MNSLLDRYCRVLDAMTALLLAIMVVLVFGNVVLRYAFNSGITVSEEMSRWLFVWLTFLGAIVALKEHGHLGTDMLVARLPVSGKKVCLVIGQLLMLFVTWLLFSGSLEQARINWDVEAAGQRRLDGHLLCLGRVLRRLGRAVAAARAVAHRHGPHHRGRAGDGAGIRRPGARAAARRCRRQALSGSPR